MKKIFTAVIAFSLLLISGCATAPVVESSTPESIAEEVSGEKTITVHYMRYDGEYEPWNLWLWADGQEGSAYEFQEENDFGVTLTATVPNSESSSTIGIIVRTNSWEKDVAEDRFITRFDSANRAEIWLIQGESEIYYERPASGPKFLSAKLDSLTEISVQVNQKIDVSGPDLALAVLSNGSELEISEVKSRFVNPVTNEFKVTLKSEVNLGAGLEVVSPIFGTKQVVMGDVYSSKAFENLYNFDGPLGPIYSKSKTTLRVWAPTATEVKTRVYADYNSGDFRDLSMEPSTKGTWTLTLMGDQHLTSYNYLVSFGSKEVEAVDPYVKSATLNGKRGVIVDLARTNPEGWGKALPKFSGKPTDAVFYELHIRDLGMDKSSGITHPGKFVSLTESGTRSSNGSITGIDAIVDLGITHLQLLPIYDYASVDESRSTQFNWGYDPLNYNVPEGSYSLDPADPISRIRDLKSAISYLSSRGVRTVMDVVYNHVFDVSSHSFQKIVPGYYFRTNPDGSWANGTGVGNEVASERSMVRKFIVDSATYWAKEYRLGGFRFDLMGIHDLETMNLVRQAVSKIDPTFLIIGEGWNMGTVLDSEQKANQLNAQLTPGISHFNDGIRDGIKGSVFDSLDRGWASGKSSARIQVMEGIVGQVKYGHGLGGQWGDVEPGQSVSYVEAHDNLTLADKLAKSNSSESIQELSKLHRFASSIALLAQGLTFIHAGQEFERSKQGDENSYKSSDSVNSLKWDQRVKNLTTVSYFKGLIKIRKDHPAFRMSSAEHVRNNLRFLEDDRIIGYELDGKAVGDSWRKILVLHNAENSALSIKLPSGNWSIAVAGSKVASGGMGSASGEYQIEGRTTAVLFQR